MAGLLLGGCRGPNPAYQVRPESDGGRPQSDRAGESVPTDLRADSSSDMPRPVDAPFDRPPDRPDVRSVDMAPDAPPIGVACPPWLGSAFVRRYRLGVQAGAQVLPPGTWVALTMNHAAVVTAGEARADGSDFKVAFYDGANWKDVLFFLDENSRWNAPDTRVWGLTLATIPAGRIDGRYYAYIAGTSVTLPSSGPPIPPTIVNVVLDGSFRHMTNGPVTITIPPMRAERAMLVFQTRYSWDRVVNMHGQITSPTTIDFLRRTEEATPTPVDVRWYLVEFANGAKAQRGTVVQLNTAGNVTLLSPVQRSRTLATYSKVHTPPTGYWTNTDPVLIDLLSNSTLQMRARGTSSNHDIGWQVIELGDASVLRGSGFLTGGLTSIAVTLPRTVNLARSFVLASFQTVGVGNDIGARMIRAELSGNNMLTIERALGGDMDDIEFGWQVVELAEGAQVQSGRADLGPGSFTATATLLPGTDPDRSIAFSTVQAGSGQNVGSTSATNTNVVGVCNATIAVQEGMAVIERNAADHACALTWNVVQFPLTGTAFAVPGVETPSGCR